MKPKVLLLVVVLLTRSELCNAATKQWTQDVSFTNADNWNVGRVPCAQDKVIFTDETNVVFLQLNGTLREVVLPINGEVVLANNMAVTFSDDNDIDPQCNGRDVTFTGGAPKHWFDPDNWKDPNAPVTVETEMLPCRHDDVVFPEDNLYSVALNQSVAVGSIKVGGRSYTESEIANYFQSNNGKLQFAVSNGVKISLTGYDCPDTTGCQCGNDEQQQTKDMICSMATCLAVSCQNPVTPEGACCTKCGAVVTMEYDHSSFNMERFKQRIQLNYGGAVNLNKRTKRQTDDSLQSSIVFYISKTQSEKIQVVITDSETGASSGKLAVEMAQRILRDIRRDMTSYGVTTASIQSSTRGTGAHGGGSTGSVSGGAIAGIIVVVIIVLALTGTAVFIYCRRVSFRKDEPLHADIEMTPTKLKEEYIHELPVDPSGVVRGFDNPVYATPPKDGKSLYADPTKSDQQANGQQVNGHQPSGSKEKNSYDHESAANGLEQLEQRDATIVGLSFTNPMQKDSMT